jgi:dTDP-4-dehydrorhamnose reductase
MRVYLTGATGFVGSNAAHVLAGRHGAELFCPVHRTPSPAGAPYASGRVDLTDAGAVRRSVLDVRPDAIVHAAILNDQARMQADRRAAWEAYVGTTRHLVDAANEVAAQLVLVSTDWVFDGTRGGATEDEPPNPVNLYGFLKAASELVVTQRAERGTVARLAGVQGVHLARPHTPRAQDAGFGYLVASLVDALRAGERFTVWRSDAINTVASPVLATDAAELMWRALQRGRTGILHCCGAEAVDRATLARRAVRAFGLDEDLLAFGPPDPAALPRWRVPHDTSLDAAATAAALGAELPGVDELLAGLREQLDATGSREAARA